MDNQPLINVLYVDDELNNLETFKANFRKECNIFLANSGAEGLCVLEHHKIHIIITDERMPEMTGADFLKIARVQNFKSIRIVISAFNDIEVFKDLINQASIYKYLSKPFIVEEIRQVINDAYQIYLERENTFKTIEKLQDNNDQIAKLFYEKQTLEKLITYNFDRLN